VGSGVGSELGGWWLRKVQTSPEPGIRWGSERVVGCLVFGWRKTGFVGQGQRWGTVKEADEDNDLNPRPKKKDTCPRSRSAASRADLEQRAGADEWGSPIG
jgi:hypothetical protein